MSKVNTLPLLKTEVEESSVITVGFTSNTYLGTGSITGMDVLSLNIQFVIVHAGPPPV